MYLILSIVDAPFDRVLNLTAESTAKGALL
jgi:hypothetical protein